MPYIRRYPMVTGRFEYSDEILYQSLPNRPYIKDYPLEIRRFGNYEGLYQNSPNARYPKEGAILGE